MPPIAVTVLTLLAQYGPSLLAEIMTLAHKDTPPTLDEWKAVFAKCKDYSAYLPDVVPVSGK